MAKYIGILSGTSLDAIDVATFEFVGDTIQTSATSLYPLPAHIKDQVLQITTGTAVSIDEFAKLDAEVGICFATAINKHLKDNHLYNEEISAIGSHGINIRHQPNLEIPFTLQIGDPNKIAQLTNIRVVADFRRMNVAVGGQGAPLAPLFHKSLFASKKIDRAIVNIGGISNVTLLKKDNSSVIGFDTGPGNCLIDTICQEVFDTPYDKDGKIASTGTVKKDLLNEFLKDPYFNRTAPKSTGREYFNRDWLSKFNLGNIIPEDLVATLTTLTATIISKDIMEYYKGEYEIYLCGGGSYNPNFVELIAKQNNQPVYSTEKLGLSPEWVEASLFAWLAKARCENIALDYTSITGSSKPCKLGALFES